MHKYGSRAGLYILASLTLTACARDMETQASATAPSPISQMTSSMAPNQAPFATPPAAASGGTVAGSLRDFQENVGDRIRFEYDRSELGPDAQDTLRKQVAWLLRYPSVTLIVEGHADERGTREYNLALGARRASAVMTFLVTMGVNQARLETISYGKERPSCSQSTDECWNENRRGVSTIKDGALSAGS